MDKLTARKTGLANRKSLSKKDRELENAVLFDILCRRCSNLNKIGVYVSIGNEADTHRFIQWALEQNKQVCVPKVNGRTLTFYLLDSWDKLKPSVFHLLEPENCEETDIEDIDIMIVPLSSFDSYGNRTGYGKGFYDSVLNRCRSRVGIAYTCQKVDEIIPDPWDIKLDEILTADSSL